MAIKYLSGKRATALKTDIFSDSLGSSADGTNTGITLIATSGTITLGSGSNGSSIGTCGDNAQGVPYVGLVCKSGSLVAGCKITNVKMDLYRHHQTGSTSAPTTALQARIIRGSDDGVQETVTSSTTFANLPTSSPSSPNVTFTFSGNYEIQVGDRIVLYYNWSNAEWYAKMDRQSGSGFVDQYVYQQSGSWDSGSSGLQPHMEITHTTNSNVKLGTGAYSFDGSDSYTTASSWGETLSDKGTVACWFNADSLASSRTIISQRINGSGNPLMVRGVDSDTIELRVGNTNAPDFTSTISTGTWYHVAVTWDRTADVVKGYLNGGLEVTSTSNGTDFTGTSGDVTAWTFGQGYNTDSGRAFTGKVDDAGVWSRILTATEINKLANNNSNENYLSATASGSKQLDESANKYGILLASNNPLIGTTLKSITFSMKKNNSPTGNVQAKIYKSDSATATATSSTTLDASTLTTSFVDKTFEFASGVTLESGDRIVFEGGSHDGTNQIAFEYNSTSFTDTVSIARYTSSWVDGISGDPMFKLMSTNTDNAQLVSSLTNKVNLKANYTMDSTALASLKGTADYTEVFASDLPTGWAEDYATGYQGNFRGNYDGSSTANALWVDFNDGTSYNIRGWIDVKTSKSIDVSDTIWTLRYTLNINTFSTGGQILMGMSTNSSKYNQSQRFLGVRIKNGDDIRLLATNNGADEPSGSNDTPSAGYDMSTSTDYFVEIYRNSSTLGLRIRTGSHTGELVHDVTQTINGSGAREHLAMDYIKFMNKNSGGSGEGIKAVFKDLKIYNDSATTTGCKNDYSADSPITNLPAGSIMEATDNGKHYIWNATTSTWTEVA